MGPQRIMLLRRYGAGRKTIVAAVREARDPLPLSDEGAVVEVKAVNDGRVITDLLIAWNGGDASALERALPLIYSDLRRLAASQMRAERANHTLQPTALINEAVIRLIGGQPSLLHSRKHLIGVLGHAMREVLVDSARKRHAGKRGKDCDRVDIDSIEISVEDGGILSVDEALRELASIQPRQAKVVELKYFGGLTLEEVASVVGASSATVTRDWRLARAWLRRAMEKK